MHIIYALLFQIITLTTQIEKTAASNEVSRIKAGFEKFERNGHSMLFSLF